MVEHKHRPQAVATRPGGGCVQPPARADGTIPCEPRAHGGCVEHQDCWCGARRSVNRNLVWAEFGRWRLPNCSRECADLATSFLVREDPLDEGGDGRGRETAPDHEV